MKKLKLACGEEVLLDDEDYDKIPKKGWYLTPCKRQDIKDDNNANRKTRYVTHDTYGKLHRYILELTHENKVMVDHIDRNGLNNQKENLRIVDGSTNKRNQSTLRVNKFNFNGINYEKEKNGRSDRIKVIWSGFEDSKYGKGKRMHKKTFTLSKFNYDYNEALRQAILFRISMMKENNYIIDERSTTIEKLCLENDNLDLEKVLNIKFSEVFK